MTSRSPTATFFLFPYRAWELLAGVLLAITFAERNLSGRYGAWVSWFGIGFIAAALLLIRPGEGFPGYQATLPVLGATMILLNVRDRNPVNAALAWPPLVFVGLISYSLYLWHWPVLTLSSYYRDGYDSPMETAGWLAVAVILSILSWRFVERPVREARRLPAIGLLGATATASAVLLAAGGMAYLRNGMVERFDPAVRMHIEASADFIQDWSRCSVASSGPLAGIEVCAVGAEGPPTFLVWGDSHVRAFKEGIELAAREQGTSGLLIWHAGCPPLFDIEKRESATTPVQDQACTDANAIIRSALPQLEGIEKVLIIGRWAYYAEGGGVGGDAANTIEMTSAGKAVDDQEALFNEGVLASIAEIATHFQDVYVLQQVPEIPDYDSRDVSRKLAHGGLPGEEEKRFTVPVEDVRARAGPSEAGFLELAARNPRIHWIPTWTRFCDGEACTSIHDSRSYYFDNNHITNTAAMALRDLFAPIVAKDGSLARASAAQTP